MCFVQRGLLSPLSRVAQMSTPFAAAALRAGTDKVSPSGVGHHYDRLYQPWLAPLRARPVQLLEIGLGCNGHAGGLGGTRASITLTLTLTLTDPRPHSKPHPRPHPNPTPT